MTDVLGERLAALADPTDDGDRLDVRRRAGRDRWLGVPRRRRQGDGGDARPLSRRDLDDLRRDRAPQPLLRAPPAGAHAAVRRLRYAEGDGELWFGEARADIARIVVTDGCGRRFGAATVAAPAALGTTLRFWAIPLPHSRASAIAGYDATGKLVKRTPVTALRGWLRLSVRRSGAAPRTGPCR